ncbi:MAG: TetR/AcrR family transcriptional regulator [Acidiferrobacteraceae bacterium]
MEQKRSDKRARLLEAANRLVHAQGFSRTTIADIAETAEVPLGNVYYYFKTKEDIGSAMIEHRARYYAGLIDSWDRLPAPRDRILALIQMVFNQREALAKSGCPVGSLCQELHKDGGPLAEKSAALFSAILSWTERQFRELGKGREAPGLALHLVSALQGASLLAHTFGQPALVARETARLRKWVRSL